METAEQVNDFMIPVDGAINDFYAHLMACPRTILSARFGDGKTFFVDKFMESERVKKTFRCLKLYPVNYQIAGDMDIFELIKRDILVQLILNGMMEEDIHIDGNIIMSFFYQNGKKDIFSTLVDFITPLTTVSNDKKNIFNVLGKLGILPFMAQKYDDYKKMQHSGQLVKQFLTAQDSGTYVQDATTRVIQEVIDIYHRLYKKRVVLFIEDMDRLDPAHLFRIMNVLSAHMDSPIKNRERQYQNRFHFDNIVLVMDYKNTEKIFHHFYGMETDYRGYIDKFCSGGYFQYSLTDNRIQYIHKQIAEQLSLPLESIIEFLPQHYFENKTIREIKEALNEVDSLLKEKPSWHKGESEVYIHLGFLKLLAVYRKLAVDENQIKHTISKVVRSKPGQLMKYIGGYIMSRDDGKACDDIYLSIGTGDNKSTVHFVFTGVNGEGLAMFETAIEAEYHDRRYDVSELFRYLYERYVAPIKIESN